MVQSLIQSKKPKQLAKTDIVFCIDISGSMESCIAGVKDCIRQFVGSIEKDPEVSIDWRLGILAHSVGLSGICFYRLALTDSVATFRSALDGLQTQIDEANLQALDWSLDFPWRPEAHKFVIMFTDEPVEGGWEPETSRAGIDDLMKKTTALGAAVFVISSDGPAFDDYKRLCTANKCRYIGIPAGKTFDSLVNDGAFEEMMAKLGKSVSQGSRGIAGAQQTVRKDIYGIAGRVAVAEL